MIVAALSRGPDRRSRISRHCRLSTTAREFAMAVSVSMRVKLRSLSCPSPVCWRRRWTIVAIGAMKHRCRSRELVPMVLRRTFHGRDALGSLLDVMLIVTWTLAPAMATLALHLSTSEAMLLKKDPHGRSMPAAAFSASMAASSANSLTNIVPWLSRNAKARPSSLGGTLTTRHPFSRAITTAPTSLMYLSLPTRRGAADVAPSGSRSGLPACV
mmetsp:Transcript_19478/g.60489  ORF Transcript_19478/g.60489 Transcript_19478/m.60489 type:complete len:214 (-) Transcript_19478:171-812(-)